MRPAHYSLTSILLIEYDLYTLLKLEFIFYLLLSKINSVIINSLFPLLVDLRSVQSVIIITVMSDNEKIEPSVLERYKVSKKLGSGAYGHVWKVTSIEKPTDSFALKKVFQAFQHATDAQRTFREISILKKLDHPNIIKLFQVMPSTSGRDIYLVFEHMTTDLYNVIYSGNLEEVHKKYVLYQLLLGLYYLHSARLIHRDLKPSNLLLSQQCQLKICDFGLVRHLGSQRSGQPILTEGVATRWYRAPQVLLGSQKYDQKADIWSVGCILAEMLLKNPLFGCNSTMAQVQRIIQVIGRPSTEEIRQIDCQIAESIIKQCGSVRPKTHKQIFASGTDQNAIDLVFKMLKFSGSRRCSAEQALRHPYLKDFFRESDLRCFKGDIVLETDDNVKLTTEAYRDLITKHFIERKEQPQRFSDLKRGDKSFGKMLGQLNSRKSSGEKDQRASNGERKNVHLFEELLREKESSLKYSRVKSSSSNKRQGVADKENININKDGKYLDKFKQTKSKQAPGTFAALRKVTANRFAK